MQTDNDLAEALADEIEQQVKAMSLLSGEDLRSALREMGKVAYVQSDRILAALRARPEARAGDGTGAPSGTGSREPSPPVSALTGVDPSRDERISESATQKQQRGFEEAERDWDDCEMPGGFN